MSLPAPKEEISRGPEPVDGPERELNAYEGQFAERMLMVQESLLLAGSEQGAKLIGVALSEFLRYLVAAHELPRREKGYGLMGDPNQGYRLVPAEKLPRQAL